MKFQIKKFSDGQYTAEGVHAGDLTLSIQGNTYSDLFYAASVKEAWDSIPENKGHLSKLRVNCLIGQRSDRRFTTGGSFDLKVIANFINSLRFSEVEVLDPHSDVTCALIENCTSISPTPWIEKAFKAIGTNPALVSPDAGAYKKVYNIAESIGADLVPANKVRLKGVPQVRVQGDVNGKDCLIVDDIADGGRTFIALSKALKQGGASRIYLYVTHGMFNFGFDEIKVEIDGVYTTDSFREIDEDIVTQFKL